jgi:hypothetical protein
LKISVDSAVYLLAQMARDGKVMLRASTAIPAEAKP